MRTTKAIDAALDRCGAALGAFIEHDTPANRAALEQARLRFRKAIEAEVLPIQQEK